MATTGAGGRARARRPRLDLSLYLVTDTALCADAGVPATVAVAVAAGVTAVQVRDPGATDAELVALGREVRAVLAGTGVPLLVNDRPDLVEAVGADGAHVGQGDMDIREARALLGEERYLGLSVQEPAHVRVAAAHGAGVLDYLGVGPVWATATKPDHAPPGGVGELRRISAASPWPCVAIGGITAERAGLLRRSGAAGIAVVSAICGQQDVAAATAAIRRAWEEGA
ncbi:thiamine phosphate synthase [Georgenia ruanii]|uniref:Thiamine-phosphate synthase n=1 Tax=Georgenia ruanii TaxID=348442 RepID=A0A7J9US90_9MICO|nr:thiamine phosphate synthase [Georgenia ruanii]MPV87213.1 thiamine phosphate synthase [Georgenia ruanii]